MAIGGPRVALPMPRHTWPVNHGSLVLSQGSQAQAWNSFPSSTAFSNQLDLLQQPKTAFVFHCFVTNDHKLIVLKQRAFITLPFLSVRRLGMN